MGAILSGFWQAVFHGDPVEFCTNFVLNRGGLAKLPVPKHEVWVVSRPEYVRRILVTDSAYFGKGGDILKTVAADLGETGLFNNDNDEQWKILRGLINPEFHINRLPQAVGVIGDFWKARMDQWQKGERVRLHDKFVQLNLHYLMWQMFGQTVSPAEVKYLAVLAQPVFDDMFKRIKNSLLLPSMAKKNEVGCSGLDAEVRRIIARPSRGGDDVVARLKAAQREKPNMITDEVIRDQVFTLLMAGFDSTATVTSWAAIALAENPNWFEHLRGEVMQELGFKMQPTLEALKRMKRMDEFLTVVLHRHPAFPLFFRGVRQDYVLGEHRLKAGATVIINLDALHQYEPTSSIPFGYGIRKCPAERLARVNMAVPLVMLLQQFDHWEHLGNSKAARFTMTRWPRDGAVMLLG